VNVYYQRKEETSILEYTSGRRILAARNLKIFAMVGRSIERRASQSKQPPTSPNVRVPREAQASDLSIRRRFTKYDTSNRVQMSELL
jgi:hypothetical protein